MANGSVSNQHSMLFLMKTSLISIFCALIAIVIAPTIALADDIRALTSFAGEDREPSVSPDGQFIAYLSDRNGDRSNQLWLLDLNTLATSPLVETLLVNSPASWHPSGQWLVFAAKELTDQPETLWQINIDGTDLKAVDTGTKVQAHMAPHISPDGEWLAYSQLVKAGTSNWDIILQNLITGERKSIVTNSPYREVWPRFAQDGKTLSYFSRADTDGGNDEIYRLTLATGKTKRLTHAKGHDFTPATSPNGPIAFVSNRTGSSMLYLMNRDGSGATQVDTGAFQARQPVWSPDGGQLYFTGRPNSGGPADIMIMDIPQSFLEN